MTRAKGVNIHNSRDHHRYICNSVQQLCLRKRGANEPQNNGGSEQVK